jgi:hypothetical protein
VRSGHSQAIERLEDGYIWFLTRRARRNTGVVVFDGKIITLYFYLFDFATLDVGCHLGDVEVRRLLRAGENAKD